MRWLNSLWTSLISPSHFLPLPRVRSPFVGNDVANKTPLGAERPAPSKRFRPSGGGRRSVDAVCKRQSIAHQAYCYLLLGIGPIPLSTVFYLRYVVHCIAG